jgi:micrococcal nuclease
MASESSLPAKQLNDVFFANGTVHKVLDGDTLQLKLSMGRQMLKDDIDDGIVTVRFSGIDCPESRRGDAWPEQPFAAEAKAYALEMLRGKTVTARLSGDVTYNRFMGEVFVDGRSASRELVRAGLAWWYRSYNEFDLDYQRLQEQAKAAKRGLWTQESPIAPWTWRHMDH